MHRDTTNDWTPDSLSARVVVFDWTPGDEPEVTYVSANAKDLLGAEIGAQGLSLSGMIVAEDRECLLQELELSLIHI